MDSKTFRRVVTDQTQRSLDMLHSKNSQYNPNEDKLRTFKAAAALHNQTPREALSGMMAKHTVSVYELCHAETLADLDVWNEKITDHINYLILLRAVVEEEGRENEKLNEERLEALREKLNNDICADIDCSSQH